MTEPVLVIGGGLAGCEAAWRIARRGVDVILYEMKPVRFSPAHHLTDLAELVCSNSLRAEHPTSAVGLLKEEMRRLDSLVMAAAEATRVPAGKALAVDRERFARYITAALSGLDRVEVVRKEVTDLDPGRTTVLASGPLTSEGLSARLADLVGDAHLKFYDAIAPIVAADSIDMSRAFIASRYQENGEGDYINCPMTEAEYQRFYEALISAEVAELHDFDHPRYFEGCLPIEVMAKRGVRTLAFGPLKPVGLTDPSTGRRPYAVVQLRKENAAGTHYNLVGFQTQLKQSEQDRVFRLIPGLEKAEFIRFGSAHRNTFINGPAHLTPFLHLKAHPNLFLAGQITGVEGYVESAATGILAGENAARTTMNRPLVAPPPTTALGGLIGHLTDPSQKDFQPSNINFGLLPPPDKKIPKKQRPAFYMERALADAAAWLKEARLAL
jgi:methylenetetrahydrofolate--tRNA-(uracil-5-)-methyltransferase